MDKAGYSKLKTSQRKSNPGLEKMDCSNKSNLDVKSSILFHPLRVVAQ